MKTSPPPAAQPPQPPPYLFGLVGFPLGHSLSPQIHAAALQALGLEGEYTLYPIPPIPQGAWEMEHLVSRLGEGWIHGLNVTIPHKEAIIPLLDELSPTAMATGAVNTLFRRGNSLVGDNTDAPGFWADIEAHFNPQRSDAPSALILGAGGSARAVAYALLTRGYHLTVAARRLEQAEALCSHFSAFHDRLEVSPLQGASLEEIQVSLIVNTTPVGMYPRTQASPWPAGTPFPPEAALYDLVYNPPETLLVRQARQAGLQAVAGLGMLVAQAALAFERWTGLAAPHQAMLAAVSP